MAEITLNIPDPIYALIERRAEATGNPIQGIIIANLAIIFGPSQYDSSKWLKSLPPGAADYTVDWE